MNHSLPASKCWQGRRSAAVCEPLAMPNPRKTEEDRMKKEFSIAFGLALLASPALAGGHQPADTLFTVTPLVSDQPGVAPNTDPDLVNPWGLARFPGNPLWVSDNGTDLSTLYDPNSGMKVALDVNIPMGAPTGIAAIPP